jgi:hypothetical protein
MVRVGVLNEGWSWEARIEKERWVNRVKCVYQNLSSLFTANNTVNVVRYCSLGRFAALLLRAGYR